MDERGRYLGFRLCQWTCHITFPADHVEVSQSVSVFSREQSASQMKGDLYTGYSVNMEGVAATSSCTRFILQALQLTTWLFLNRDRTIKSEANPGHISLHRLEGTQGKYSAEIKRVPSLL
jgi:hypothetical protein